MNELSHDQDREKNRVADVTQRIIQSVQPPGEKEVADFERDVIAADQAEQTNNKKVLQSKRDDIGPEPEVEVKAAQSDVGRPELEKKGEDTDQEFITPDALRKRYLLAENKFYFRDDTNKVAFEDKGKRLATEHDDPDIAKSMVELASAKSWTAIKLKGTDEFKREAWLHASIRGMQVQGYKPKDVDLARLADHQAELGRRADKSLNSIERSEPREKDAVIDEQQRTLSAQQRTAIDHLKAILRERGDSEKAVDMAASMAAERFQTNRVYVGKMVEYGRAPYEHDPRNEESYYLKLQTASGVRTVWGVDLQRATEASNANVDDYVAVAYQGRQQVTVKVTDRDAQGNVTGERDMLTYRNTWEVNRLDKMREDAKKSIELQARSGERQPQVLVYDRNADRAQPRADLPPLQAKERERDRARG